MNGSIICGVDDSESAKRAARAARALSRELGLDLVFVHAVDRWAADGDASATAERLEGLRAGASPADRGAAWSVDVGHPVDVLVAAANRTQAALIVVGSTGPRSSLLGSVSADVSRRAPCPVVVVPPGAALAVGGRAKSNGLHHASELARHGVAAGGTDLAGGVARFGLGSADREP